MREALPFMAGRSNSDDGAVIIFTFLASIPLISGGLQPRSPHPGAGLLGCSYVGAVGLTRRRGEPQRCVHVSRAAWLYFAAKTVFIVVWAEISLRSWF